MAGERILPGLGLTGYWTLGDDTWKPGMDSNLRTLSVVAGQAVLSSVAVEPGSPTDGDIHIATAVWGGAAINDIVIRDDGAWVPITPQSGWVLTDLATGLPMRFDGANWVTVLTEAQIRSLLPAAIVNDTALDRVISNSDLDGSKIIERDNASANTVTINSGLTSTQPVTIINQGVGQTSFVAGGGVTINSKGGALKLSAQYSSATLIPRGSDNYNLIGDLVV